MKFLSKIILILFYLAVFCLAEEPAAQKNESTVPRKLSAKIAKVEFSGTLQNAISYLSRESGITITADWKELSDANVAPNKKVAITLNDVSCENTLDYLVEVAAVKNHPLVWFEKSGIVIITSKTSRLKQNRRGKLAETFTIDKTPPKQLSQRQPLEFNKISLSQTIDAFAEKIGLNIYVNWRSLDQSGIKPQTPVSLKLGNITLGVALDMLCDHISQSMNKYDRVYWVYEDNIIKIATGNFFNRKLITVNFDITSMMHIIPQNKAPKIKGHSSRITSGRQPQSFEFGDNDDDDNDMPSKEDIQNKLRIMLYAATGQDMWKPQGKGTIIFFSNRMLISQTRLGYELISRALR